MARGSDPTTGTKPTWACMDGKVTFYHFTKNIKLECDGSYRIKPQANGCPGPPRS